MFRNIKSSLAKVVPQRIRGWIPNRPQLLRQSKVFCMAPWSHLHVLPVGQIFPCCLSAHLHHLALGELHQGDTLKGAWNSERMRALRLNMIQGKKSKLCERCYQQEEIGQESFRLSVNNTMAHHFDIVSQTQPDGRLERLNLPYLDIRFSNLCNYKCRICNPTLSSRWYEDAKALWGKELWEKLGNQPKLITASKDPEVLWEQIEPLIPQIEKIQFAGGEPLVMEEHYKILDTFIQQKMFGVDISYNTNLSVLKFRHYDVPTMWRHFKRIFIMASLDGMGARGDYMRKGQHWEQTVENRERLLRECPHITFKVYPTVSIMNVLHMPDFYREWLEKGYITADGMFLNILFEPEYYNVRGLTPSLKRRVEEKYHEFIDVYLNDVGDDARVVKEHFESVLTYMNAKQLDIVEEFRDVTQRLDVLRRENFHDVFPELGEMFQAETNTGAHARLGG